jgi:hypothetical protein
MIVQEVNPGPDVQTDEQLRGECSQGDSAMIKVVEHLCRVDQEVHVHNIPSVTSSWHGSGAYNLV